MLLLLCCFRVTSFKLGKKVMKLLFPLSLGHLEESADLSSDVWKF